MLIQFGACNLQSKQSLIFCASKAAVLTGTDAQRVVFALLELLAMDMFKPIHFPFKALAGRTTHARSYRQMAIASWLNDHPSEYRGSAKCAGGHCPRGLELFVLRTERNDT
jgi:hypothetical protein